MDLTWDLSRGKSYFILLATGAMQLRRKQFIIYLKIICFNVTAFLLLPFPI